MLTLCLLFYAQAMAQSVAILLAFTSACKQKKHYVKRHVKFAISYGYYMLIICQLYMPLIIPNLCYIYAYYELHHYNEAINVYHPSGYVSPLEAIYVDLVQQIKFCTKLTIAT